jgi:hypothetical protein
MAFTLKEKRFKDLPDMLVHRQIIVTQQSNLAPQDFEKYERDTIRFENELPKIFSHCHHSGRRNLEMAISRICPPKNDIPRFKKFRLILECLLSIAAIFTGSIVIAREDSLPAILKTITITMTIAAIIFIIISLRKNRPTNSHLLKNTKK